MQLLEQLKSPKFVAADTMNCWIENHVEELKKLLGRIDALILNEGEAKLLTKADNLVVAAEELLKMGPKAVIIKKGSHGTIFLDSSGSWFTLPAYPTKNVRDPTGAGDSFAGALMGYLASIGRTDARYLRTAIAYGTVTASLVIEGFSLSAVAAIGRSVIDARLEQLRKMTEF